MSARRLAVLVCGGFVITSCWLFASLDDATGDAGDVAVGETSDAQSSDFADPSRWASYDVSFIDTNPHSYAAFDGRYVYFLPGTSLLAYDTQKVFDQQAAWSVQLVDGGGYSAVVTGASLELLSKTTSRAIATNGQLDAQAWSQLTLSDAGAPQVTFSGATFDGRYVYSFGDGDGGVYLSRRDTTVSFTDPSGWCFTLAFPGLDHHGGTTFDGRFVYGMADLDGGGAVGIRYDVEGGIDAASSYESFKLTNQITAQNLKSQLGATFDGQYVYFTPDVASSSWNCLVRFDTDAGAFDVNGNWAAHVLSLTKTSGYQTAGPVFDGRYLYLVEQAGSRIMRYDTLAIFDAESAYEIVDVLTVTGSDAGKNVKLWGGAFDGQYVYFATASDSNAHRVFRFKAFDAPGPMPAAYHGSFH